jgi:hypothetical protein
VRQRDHLNSGVLPLPSEGSEVREPERIDRILSTLGEVWKERPDWRLGQLISNTMGTGPQDVFHLEDDELEAVLETWKGDK